MIILTALISLTSLLLTSAQVQLDNPIAQDAAQVQVLLDEIKIEGLKKFGAFSDYNPQQARDAIRKATFNDGTEASVNRPVLDYLFENDIVLTVPQAQTILEEIRNSDGLKRNPRQAQPGERYFWKDHRVAYSFKFNDNKWQNLIREALQHLEDETCMRFYENATDTDALQFTRAGGCWSNVGRVGGKQTVSIGYGCDALGIVAHETLHALGLWHEQSRYDRDDYVNIDFGFIFPGTQSNFAKRNPKNSDNMGQRYDLGSVMHYGAKAFSTDYSRDTIVTKDENYQYTIGQRVGVSFKDARMINLRYCTDICKKELKCNNGGYTDPNNCEKCKCPKGLGGTYCDEVAYSPDNVCNGRDIKASSQWSEMVSPSLDGGINCFWRILAPKGESVEIQMTYSSFPCKDACSSFVELKYLADKTTTGARLCCDLPRKTIVSEDNSVLLWLRSDPELIPGYLGFKLRYRTVPSTATPAPIPTTTTTTTIRTTTTGSGEPEWSDWGEWGVCSVRCGGCGEKRRVRACYGGDGICEGKDVDIEYCGQEPCEKPKSKTTRCSGRLVLPCDLMDDLDFGTTHSSDPFQKPIIELLQSPKNAKALKKARREAAVRARRFVDGNKQMADGDFCEKRFTYNCPTSLLTINIDRRTNKDVVFDTCCPGFIRNQGQCIKARG